MEIASSPSNPQASTEPPPSGRPSMRPSLMPPPPEPSAIKRYTERSLHFFEHVGIIWHMFVGSIRAGFRRPFEGRAILKQMDSLGVASVGIVAVTEQIDAIRALGADPLKKLVWPRLLASVIVMPVVAAFSLVLGFAGATMITDLQFDIPAAFFLRSALGAVNMSDFAAGMIKTPVFGAIIALVGCHFGMTTKGGTAGVGNSTTRTVVVISIAILIADFFLTKLAIILWPQA